jgi:hypothetical protein
MSPLFSGRMPEHLHKPTEPPIEGAHPRAGILFGSEKEKTLGHKIRLPHTMLQKEILGEQSLMLPYDKIVRIIESHLAQKGAFFKIHPAPDTLQTFPTPWLKAPVGPELGNTLVDLYLIIHSLTSPLCWKTFLELRCGFFRKRGTSLLQAQPWYYFFCNLQYFPVKMIKKTPASHKPLTGERWRKPPKRSKKPLQRSGHLGIMSPVSGD